jgi:hypothetical protein
MWGGVGIASHVPLKEFPLYPGYFLLSLKVFVDRQLYDAE